jgi:hypothetical protein
VDRAGTSICPFCAVCAQLVYAKQGTPIQIEGDPRSPVNQGTLCPKGVATHADEDRRKLEHLNASVSVVVGGQFPLGMVPWHEIAMVRVDLVRLFSGMPTRSRCRTTLATGLYAPR